MTDKKKYKVLLNVHFKHKLTPNVAGDKLWLTDQQAQTAEGLGLVKLCENQEPDVVVETPPVVVPDFIPDAPDLATKPLDEKATPDGMDEGPPALKNIRTSRRKPAKKKSG